MLAKRSILLLLIVLILSCEKKQEEAAAAFETVFEKSGGTETVNYSDAIEFYISLAREYPEINIQTIGPTDSGFPMHLVTFNGDADFNFQRIKEEKAIVMVLNGIHPGESDGIDASMLLFRDLASGKIPTPENTVVVTIPIYNIGGALNRNSTTRVNQSGPKSYGFRGNARNYDLNRDFIKQDSENARSFAEIYHRVAPDVFIDTHVSNGANYQYTLTHLFTQPDKLGGTLGNYVDTEFIPELVAAMGKAGHDIIPFVNIYNRPPDNGYPQFLDHPRYSTGYTTLWNTVGMMVETHMLKPYPGRVTATYDMLYQMIELTDENWESIRDLREQASQQFKPGEYYPLNWKIDSTRVVELEFKGYVADTITSTLTGLPRLLYDEQRPFTKKIPYYNGYRPSDSVRIPEAYIIRQSWSPVVERLRQNQVQMEILTQDTVLSVESYKIESYQTANRAFEGHYPHFNTNVSASQGRVAFSEGDFLIRTEQPGIRFILETLEPEAVDSYFNWNFFDPILQRKEHFSAYVFEDLALQFLQENDSLYTLFKAEKSMNEDFASSAYRQLSWIYERSPYYELAHNQYPVYRILTFSGSDD